MPQYRPDCFKNFVDLDICFYFCEESIRSTIRLIKRDLCTFFKYKQKQVLKDLVASVCTQIYRNSIQYLHKNAL